MIEVPREPRAHAAAQPWQDVAMSRFLIVMRENDGAWEQLPPAVQTRILERYQAWVAGLREQGCFVDGAALAPEGRILSLEGTELRVQRALGTSAVPAGYLVIEASDWDAAIALAGACPALGHGETVEVRLLV